MKQPLIGLATVVALLLAVPILGAAGRNALSPTLLCGDTAVILDTIRTLESGGDYTAQARGASASGAYQMIDSTWRQWSAAVGYPDQWAHAREAPPSVQDKAAAALLAHILDTYGNDVSVVPVAWYYPAAINNDALMDQVPWASAGNTLTPRQYQARWMTVYRSKSTGGGGCPTVIDGWALPVPRALLERNLAAVNVPHHDYPAWDFPTAIGTEIYAVRGGTVVYVSNWPGNCGGKIDGCPSRCGLGVTVLDTDGYRWIYCHASRVDVTLGTAVTAGTRLMLSGNTGNSSGPHLHLGLRRDGVDYCPQPLLARLLGGASPAAIAQNNGCAS